MGLTTQELDRMLDAARASDPETRRELFSGMRSAALRNFSNLDGVASIEGLVAVLKREVEEDKAPELPRWVHDPADARELDSSSVVGASAQGGSKLRRPLGYRACDNRGCFRAETRDVRLSRCGG